jgi:hypothetical protein
MGLKTLIEIPVNVPEYYTDIINDIFPLIFQMVMIAIVVNGNKDFNSIAIGTAIGFLFKQLVGRHLIRFIGVPETI